MAAERTPTAATGDWPVNRSAHRTAQFLGISKAERGLEKIGPVGDGGGDSHLRTRLRFPVL
jgi:hypothetical protein